MRYNERMIEYVFTTVLMFCLSAALFLMVRALPRVVEEPSESKGLLDRWANSELPEKIDIAFNGFLFKFLRRIKIAVLKIDNGLGSQLQKMKAKEDDLERRSAIDFREIAEGGLPEGVEERRKGGRRASDRTDGGGL